MDFVPNQCDMPTAFKRMKMVSLPVVTSAAATTDKKQIINISFCGDYAGRVWHGYTRCAERTHTSSCEEYVANNPDKFTDVYFVINSVRHFQRNSGKDNSAAVAAAAPTTTLSRIHSRRPSTSTSRLISSISTTIGGHDYYP
jgi:mevalonate pyrophosphate decarboxylase